MFSRLKFEKYINVIKLSKRNKIKTGDIFRDEENIKDKMLEVGKTKIKVNGINKVKTRPKL